MFKSDCANQQADLSFCCLSMQEGKFVFEVLLSCNYDSLLMKSSKVIFNHLFPQSENTKKIGKTSIIGVF